MNNDEFTFNSSTDDVKSAEMRNIMHIEKQKFSSLEKININKKNKGNNIHQFIQKQGSLNASVNNTAMTLSKIYTNALPTSKPSVNITA